MLAKSLQKKIELETWLDEVDYVSLNSSYVPSEFALVFMNFIKLVNGEEGEQNKTPPVHLKMLDKMVGTRRYVANLCFRGAAKALSLGTPLLAEGGWTTVAAVQPGDRIYGEDGQLTTILAKSEIFNEPMYRLHLGDGRTLDVSENHINTIIHKRVKRVEGRCTTYCDRRNVTTKELLSIPLGSTRTKTEKNPRGWENSVWIPLAQPVDSPEKELPVDPYTLGVLLGDGSISRQTGYARLHCHKDDLSHYLSRIPYETGRQNLDKRNNNVVTVGVLGLGKQLKAMGLNCHGDDKQIPDAYLHGSIKQRVSLLHGLMDTDGTVNKASPSFATNSLALAQGVLYLAYSLGGVGRLQANTTASGKKGYRVTLNCPMEVFSLPRKVEKKKAKFLNKVPLIKIEPIDQVASQCLMVDNGTKTFLAGDFVVTHNTTLFMEYMTLYIAVMGNLPGFGDVSGMIYVSDSMDNGVKSARKNIEFRYNNSPFLQEWLPDVKFTDAYLEFTNRDGHKLGVKMFGAKALSLDSVLFLGSGGTTTIGQCAVGDVIIGADGQPTTITRKSEIFHKPMYLLTLDDGRTLKVSEDHLNQVHVKKFASAKTFSSYTLEEKTLTTLELLQESMYAVDPNGSKRPLLWVENARPVEWPQNQDQLIDPYTVGLLIGDGSMNTKGNKTAPVVLTAHEDDWPTYEKECPYSFGSVQRDTRHPATISRTVLGISNFVAIHGLNTHGKFKKVPNAYKYASVEQRLAILQGMMDTDGTCTLDGKSSFCSASKALVEDVMWLCRSLGGESRWMHKGNERAFQCSVRLSMPLFRLQRKLVRQRDLRNDKVSIKSIERIDDEPSQCIAVDNEERQFLANDFFRTHNTGIRGTKIFGKRPTLCILDDLVSDDDAKSPTSMQAIKDTVYKGVFPALDPTRRKVVFNGTPFNKDDIIIEAVESGAWDVNVWPVCERFPCEQEEFVGAWEDRFDYAFVKEQYDLMAQSGKLAAFYQEYMLRITSEEDRLIHDHDIRWYSRDSLLANKGIFHFYITTDFATSAKQSADYTVISVWAYNANGEWFWVDGIAARQTMDKTVNDLFSLVHEYQPMAVGVEITGQQGGFIPWLQEQMFTRNIWFTFASSEKSGAPGIRSAGDKLVRMNMVLPWFKAGKMHFPKEMQTSNIMGLFMGQLRLVTQNGIKGKDDCLDTISQLAYLKPWKPSQTRPVEHTITESSYWTTPAQEAPSALSSYIV